MIETITTERLVLREVEKGDAASILKLFRQPDCIKFIGDKGLNTIEDAEAYIVNGPIKSYQEHDMGLLAVCLNNKFVGLCGLLKRPELELPDLGFAFLKESYGKGFAFEASSGVLAKNKGIGKVIALTHEENMASISLLNKLGFELAQKVPFGEDKALSNLFELEC